MRRAILAGVSSVLILWLGFTALVLWGNYTAVVPAVTLAPGNSNWQMLSGQGGQRGDSWAIRSPGRRGHALVGISLPGPDSVEKYDRIVVRLGQEHANRRMRLGWSGTTSMNPRSLMSLKQDKERSAFIETRWLKPGAGQVRFVFLELTGAVDGPFLIEAIRLEPSRPGFAELQKRLFSEWIQFAPWTQRSTNQTRAALQPVLVSPAVGVGVWLLLAGLICAVSARGRIAAKWPALLVLAVCGWLILDVRWQADLLGKGLRTIDAFYGKSAQQRRSADLDGELFGFLKNLQERVGVGERRLFALGHGDYWRARARYHGLPWSTRSTDRDLSHDWTEYLRKGDLLLRMDAPYIKQMSHRRRADREGGFKNAFGIARVVGRGARLISQDGGSLVQIDPGSKELIQARGNALAGGAFYQFSVQLRSVGGEGAARLIVRWKDNEVRRVKAADRLYELSGSGFERYEVAFALPRDQKVDFFVVTDTRSRVQARAVGVESLDPDGLVWLESSQRGPFLVVRPIMVNRLYRAYEVL